TGTTFNHLTFEPRALSDFSFKERGPLMPEPFKLTALLLRQQLCLFSLRDVQADSNQPLRVSVFIHLDAAARADPLHSAVCTNHPKLCLIIFAISDRVIHCLPDFLAILCVPSGNELFKCDPSRSGETQLCTARWAHPDFIFLQIPLPHCEFGGIRGEI